MLDKLKSLTPAIQSIALDKATEPPFSGKYLEQCKVPGSFLCRRCGLPLWSNQDQFPSSCGWPSFDKRLNHAIDEIPDADGLRTEIICHRCQSHLGHVFRGEGFTPRDQRDCVNSIMIDFVPYLNLEDSEEIIVAGGCFWGLEYLMQQETGVLLTECGYLGGKIPEPNYEMVCSQNTGHYEGLRIIFNPKISSSLKLFRHFFEIHDPSQKDGQGPDLGPQYQSAAFYYNAKQKAEIEALIHQLEVQGLKVYTRVLPVSCFWPAEDYHQNYYRKQQKQPYCHVKTQRF